MVLLVHADFSNQPKNSWSHPQKRESGYKINESAILGVHVSLCSEHLFYLFILSNLAVTQHM